MEVTLRTCQSVPFYACGGFDPSVCAHGFSTRLGGVSPAPWDSLNLGANRGRPGTGGGEFPPLLLCGGGRPAALVKNHQVHGDLVRPVTRRDVMSSSAEPGVYEADGLITDEPGLCLTIFSADCIPRAAAGPGAPLRCCCPRRLAGDRPGHRSPGRPSGCGRTTAAARNISGPPSGLGSPPAAF